MFWDFISGLIYYGLIIIIILVVLLSIYILAKEPIQWIIKKIRGE